MVSMFASNVVDHGFDPWLGQSMIMDLTPD